VFTSLEIREDLGLLTKKNESETLAAVEKRKNLNPKVNSSKTTGTIKDGLKQGGNKELLRRIEGVLVRQKNVLSDSTPEEGGMFIKGGKRSLGKRGKNNDKPITDKTAFAETKHVGKEEDWSRLTGTI